jgi:hypothetical protein
VLKGPEDSIERLTAAVEPEPESAAAHNAVAFKFA